jgi:hypothetical protein
LLKDKTLALCERTINCTRYSIEISTSITFHLHFCNVSITVWVLLLFLSTVHSIAMNPFTAPYGNELIPEGQPFTIEWTPTTPGPVYLQLSYGDNVIASNVTGLSASLSSQENNIDSDLC